MRWMACGCRCPKNKSRMRTLAALVVLCAADAAGADVSAARYTEPTTRYAHGVLGDAIEYGALEMDTADGIVTVRLPDSRVFEDTVPRLIDIDGDGAREVLVVESALDAGARVAVFGANGALVAATPFIGQRNRWYAPVGAADLDGDGFVEVAYVDRPHLAKILRVWRYRDGDFSEVAQLPAVTNHRIGEADIAGGIRDCGEGPEMIVADAQWQAVLAIRFDGQFSVANLGPHQGRPSFATAMACD